MADSGIKKTTVVNRQVLFHTSGIDGKLAAATDEETPDGVEYDYVFPNVRHGCEAKWWLLV